MSRFGLIGPSYAAQSLNADAQATINMYVEQNESGAANAPLSLLPTPGTKLYVDLQTGGELDGAVTATGTAAGVTITGTPSVTPELAVLLTSIVTGQTVNAQGGWTDPNGQTANVINYQLLGSGSASRSHANLYRRRPLRFDTGVFQKQRSGSGMDQARKRQRFRSRRPAER